MFWHLLTSTHLLSQSVSQSSEENKIGLFYLIAAGGYIFFKLHLSLSESIVDFSEKKIMTSYNSGNEKVNW